MSKPVVNLLKKVRKLLSEKKNWTQGTYAKSNENWPLAVNSPIASSWCLDGAIFKYSSSKEFYWIVGDYLKTFLPKGFTSLISYNDNRSHRSVLRLLDKAIKG